MKYTIYQLVEPEILEVKRRSYQDDNKERTVLEKLNIRGIENEHTSFEGAVSEITNKSEQLKHLKLTIIPVITVGWDGDIYIR